MTVTTEKLANCPTPLSNTNDLRMTQNDHFAWVMDTLAAVLWVFCSHYWACHPGPLGKSMELSGTLLLSVSPVSTMVSCHQGRVVHRHILSPRSQQHHSIPDNRLAKSIIFILDRTWKRTRVFRRTLPERKTRPRLWLASLSPGS